MPTACALAPPRRAARRSDARAAAAQMSALFSFPPFFKFATDQARAPSAAVRAAIASPTASLYLREDTRCARRDRAADSSAALSTPYNAQARSMMVQRSASIGVDWPAAVAALEGAAQWDAARDAVENKALQYPPYYLVRRRCARARSRARRCDRPQVSAHTAPRGLSRAPLCPLSEGALPRVRVRQHVVARRLGS